MKREDFEKVFLAIREYTKLLAEHDLTLSAETREGIVDGEITLDDDCNISISWETYRGGGKSDYHSFDLNEF
ncbi:MAG: hypothetical protein WC824_13870, partial [Bacteroidota bacterium]